mgnify:FL=1
MRVGDLALWKATGKDYDVLVVIVKNVEGIGCHYYCQTIDDPYTYLVRRKDLKAVV